MKTIAAKKIVKTFLLMLMVGFMSLMLSSASSTKNVSSQSSDKCFYLLQHVMGGPNNPKTVPIFVPDNRLEEHLAHGDKFLLPNCVSNIGDLVSSHDTPGNNYGHDK